MEQKNEVSVYNEAIQQIIRIGNHWVEISRLREQGKLKKVKFKLDSVEAELKYDIEETLDNLKYKERLKAINQSIRDAEKKVIRYTLKYQKEIDEEIIEKVYNFNLYSPLLKKEELLREVQQKSGKGSSYKSSEEEDMD